MPNQRDIQNFIESAKIYNTIGTNKQQALNDEAARSDNYLLNQARLESSAFDLKRQQYELSQKQEQDRRVKREQALMSEAFKSSSHERTAKNDAEGEDMLSQQFTDIGKKLIAGGSPEQGIAYLKEGQKFKTAAVDKIKTDLELRAAKVEAQGEVASGVFDNASAQAATQEMAKLGFVVPEQYRNFTPAAQEWWKNRAMFSKNFARSIKAENDALRANNDTIRTQQKEEELDFKKKEADRKEELARLRINVSRSKIKPLNKEAMKTEVGALVEASDKVEDQDKETQRVMAEDVNAVAMTLLTENPNLSQDEAKRQARNVVVGRIKEDGKYPLLSEGVKKEDTTIDWKAKLGNKYKPNYRYWVENGRIKGEPQ